MDWNRIPYTKILIEKQCKFAKISFNDIDFDEDEWYHNNTWTYNQEDEFKKWFIDFLYHNKGARKEIMAYPSRNKELIEKVWHWWNLMYGFRIKED